MSSLVVFLASVAVVVCGLMILSYLNTRRIPLRIHILGSLIAPIMLTLVFLLGSGEYGDVRVALQGFEFKLPMAADGKLSIGGRGKNDGQFPSDHIRVRSVGAQAVTIGADARSMVLTVNNDTISADEPPRGLVVIKSAPQRGDLTLTNTYRLADGDRLVETGAAGRVWTWRAAERRLELGGRPCRVVPKRKSVLPFVNIALPVNKNNDADLAIFPLLFFGRALSTTMGSAQDLATGAFLHWGGGGLNHDVMLTLTDPGLVLESAGEQHSFSATPVVYTSSDTTAQIMICRVDYREPKDGYDSGGRVTDLREMTLHRHEWTLKIQLKTPSYLTLDNTLMEPHEAGEYPSLYLYDRMHAEMGDRSQLLLDFSVCGDRLLRQLFCRIEPQEDGRFEVTVPAGIQQVEPGSSFVAGDEVAVIMNIARLEFPGSLLLMIWAAAILFYAAGRHAGREPVIYVVLLTTQYLLAWRLLIGFEGYLLDPRVAAGVSRSAAAYLVVPTLLTVLANLAEMQVKGRSWRDYLTAFPEAIVLAVPLIGACAGAFMMLMKDHASLEAKIFSALGLLAFAGFVRPLLVWLTQLETTDRPSLFRRLVILTFGMFVLRLVLLMGMGAKEAIMVGNTRFTVSLAADPAFALLLAIAWRQLIPQTQQKIQSPDLLRRVLYRFRLQTWVESRGIRFFLGVGFVTVAMLVSHLAVHDSGGIFIMILPALLMLPLWATGRRALLYIPVFLYFILLIVVPFVFQQGGIGGPEHGDALGDTAAAREYVKIRLEQNRNSMRVLSWVNPDRVRDFGTRSSEDMSIVFENLHDYATQGMLGRGYLRSRLSPVLTSTHLNDNLTAVHILAPFGWLGALGLIVVLVQLAAFPVMLCIRRRKQHQLMTGVEVMGILCVWIVASSGIYMIAANANLVVFTGKNAILLAANSLGDLLHGIALMALAVLCFFRPPKGRK